jgi:phosphoribosylformylglycinamidine cyclo-ligase
MKGIAQGCQEAGCALIGGETAELPGMYTGEKLDLAGFSVGIVEKNKIIDGSTCKPGDKIIGLASNGLHSNGFSLVRKIFSKEEMKGKLGREMLKPTRIYVKPVLQAAKKVRLKALAHITGGGFQDNIPRVLPKGLVAKIREDSWTVPQIFKKIKNQGGVEEKEMFRTFNMGIGLVVIVGSRSARHAVDIFQNLGQKAWVIGELVYE